MVVYYRARAVSSREDSSDKLSELVFRAAHYQRSLPPAEEFPNTRHYRLAQWFHLATRPAQSVSSTYFRGSLATDREWYLRLYHLVLTEKPVGPWIVYRLKISVP